MEEQAKYEAAQGEGQPAGPEARSSIGKYGKAMLKRIEQQEKIKRLIQAQIDVINHATDLAQEACDLEVQLALQDLLAQALEIMDDETASRKQKFIRLVKETTDPLAVILQWLDF